MNSVLEMIRAHRGYPPVDIVQAAKDARAIFSTLEGERFLRFMMENFFFLTTTLQRIPLLGGEMGGADPYASGIAEGQRMAFITIVNLMDEEIILKAIETEEKYNAAGR